MDRAHFVIYPEDGEYRWRFVDHEGHELAASKVGFRCKSTAEAGVRAFVATVVHIGTKGLVAAATPPIHFEPVVMA